MSKMHTFYCGVAALTMAVSAPVYAQEAGEGFVKVAAARTKLVDKGVVATNGVVDPEAGYETREAFHGVVTGGYFVLDSLAVEASITTPLTTNNIPAGSLAGVPNLGDDEFVVATVGASFHPLKGQVRPYVGGGYAFQFTTQERDGLGVNLNIPSTNGPYVNAGVNVGLTNRLDLFVDGRKSWYSTNATGLLPLDATFTTFAEVDADAELDPLTIQLGLAVRFGHSGGNSTLSEINMPSTSKWVIKAGLTSLELADRVDLKVGGVELPGADLSTFEHHTPSVQVGYFLTDNIAVNATVGFPPTIDIFGGGTIGALPKLGEITYGPTVFTVQYHPLRSGVFRPYIGAGASYMFVFDTKDGAFGDLRVEEDLAFAFEAGVDMMVSNKMGVFVDAKKALLRPKAFGTFDGATVEGQTRLDPWAFSGGVSFHF